VTSVCNSVKMVTRTIKLDQELPHHEDVAGTVCDQWSDQWSDQWGAQ
jgi:hypothetical protein